MLTFGVDILSTIALCLGTFSGSVDSHNVVLLMTGLWNTGFTPVATFFQIAISSTVNWKSPVELPHLYG